MMYELIIYIQNAETTEELDAMRDDEQALIAFMSNWDYGEEVEEVEEGDIASNLGDEIVAEDKYYRVVRNIAAGGTYALYRKKN